MNDKPVIIDNENHPKEMDERKLRIDHRQLKENWRRQNFRAEVQNSHQNYRSIQEWHESGRLIDTHDLPKMEEKTPCLVVGSGSSLDDILPHIMEWQGDIICSTSQLSTLTYHGKTPRYCVVVDPRMGPTLASVDGELAHPTREEAWGDAFLVTHPGCPPPYLERWPGKIALYGLQDSSEPYYVVTQRIAYEWLKGFFVPMSDAVSCEIALAFSLGYSPVYLIGVDYGGPRFEMKYWDGTAWQTKSGVGSDAGSFVISKGGLKTDPMMLYMKRGALLAILTILSLGRESGKRPRIWNIADRGKSTLTEIPHADWKGAFRNAKDLRRPADDQTLNAMFENIEVSLAQMDVYVAYVHNGLHPGVRIMQSYDESALRKQITDLNRTLVESKVQAEGFQAQQKGKSVSDMVKEGILIPPAGLPKEEYLAYDPSKIKWIADVDGYIERAKDLRKRALE
jgi:hypothetical protein